MTLVFCGKRTSYRDVSWCLWKTMREDLVAAKLVGCSIDADDEFSASQ